MELPSCKHRRFVGWHTGTCVVSADSADDEGWSQIQKLVIRAHAQWRWHVTAMAGRFASWSVWKSSFLDVSGRKRSNKMRSVFKRDETSLHASDEGRRGPGWSPDDGGGLEVGVTAGNSGGKVGSAGSLRTVKVHWPSVRGIGGLKSGSTPYCVCSSCLILCL